MTSEQNRRLSILLAVGLASYSVGGCSSAPEDSSGTGGGPGGSSAGSGGPAGTSGSGLGGSTGTAGSGVQGTAGSVGTGGSTGGSPGTGGSSSLGGAPGAGGTGTGGSSAGVGGSGGGGVGTGGSSAAGRGGSTGGAGRGGSSGGLGGSTGGGGSGSCQKGQTKGSEVVIMGESFYAIAPQYIQNRLQDNARKAGSLGASDKYRNVAVSGQNMNYIATTEWNEATKMPVKWVIMDGGGIDCLTGSSCPTCMGTFKTLLGKMATAGVTDVIYTRYPEPGAPPGSTPS